MIFPIKQWCPAILFLIVCSAVHVRAQENRPRSPQLEKHAEASPNKTPLAAKRKTNIVFLLMDNLGYGELGVYGGGVLRGAPTPRIDKPASGGMGLLHFHVEAQWTPPPAGLMTGRLPLRSCPYKIPLRGLTSRLVLW